jgi:glycosyltransferase involved in cell wall biosynthesis
MSAKPMKILFISSRADIGGGPKHLLQLISNLPPNFTIYTAAPKNYHFSEALEAISTSYIGIPHRKFSLTIFFKLLLLCKEEGIKTVHSHGRGAGIYSRLLALFGLKVVHTFHGAHNASGIKGKIKLLIDKFLSPLTSTFICVSKSEFKKATNLGLIGTVDTKIIHNGIDLDIVDLVEKEDLQKKYSLRLNVKIWGTLARISPEKGIDLLINTVEKENLSDFEFLVAGGGEMMKEYSSKLKEKSIHNIHLIGEITTPISFLKGLDGYFSYSRGEGLPLSVLEAMACELPCVLSDVTGHDQFKDDVTLFDLNSPQDFKKKLNEGHQFSYTLTLKSYNLRNMVNCTGSLY